MSSGIGKEFMRRTQYRFLEKSDQMKGLPQPPVVQTPEPGKEIFDLPEPRDLRVKSIELRKAIEGRRSVRSYSGKPLSLDDLSWLLWATQGIKGSADRHATIRTVPSAGARHPFETYILVNNVENLGRGLYRFIADEHRLQEVDLRRNISSDITDACYGQRMVMDSAATFIWVAIAYRTTWRYSDRGYRYVLLDAGHVCQNLYLAAEAVDSGVCAIGAFYDEKLNHVIGVDGEEQLAVYVATVGKKRR